MLSGYEAGFLEAGPALRSSAVTQSFPTGLPAALACVTGPCRVC